jgi:hypothetical protein
MIRRIEIMSGKFTYRLLLAGMTAAILLVCILSLIIFLPGGKQSQMQQAQRVKLSVASNPATAGETIMVNGFEYPADAKVDVYVQDRANGVVSTTANKGGFFNVPLTLPKRYIKGPAYIYAVSGNLTTRVQLHFIKPTVIYYAPAHRSPFASFQGAGFVAHESVNYVLIVGGNHKITGTQMTDSQGHFTVALKLPDTSLDSKAVFIATDKLRSNPVTVNFRYYPQIQLSSFVGIATTTLRVLGRRYASGEVVRILFQGRQVALFYANRNGDFAVTFRIPTTANTSSYYNDVQAIGLRSGAIASDSFQVLPSVSFSTRIAAPGQRITATGSQFTPNETVQVVLFSLTQGASSVGERLQNASVSRDGNFRVNFSIPSNVARRQVYRIVYIDVASGLDVDKYFKVV